MDSNQNYMVSEKDFQDDEHRKAWLLRVAVNKSKNVLRSRRRRSYINLDDIKEVVAGEEKQDKEDSFLYRHTKENKFFSVILYHLQTEYQTVRGAKKLKKFESSLGEGYYGGSKYSYYAILIFKDSDYMVYIDGANMPLKEVKKIARGSSLVEVEKKKDIQASFIEWTKERQEETNNFRKIQYSH